MEQTKYKDNQMQQLHTTQWTHKGKQQQWSSSKNFYKDNIMQVLKKENSLNNIEE